MQSQHPSAGGNSFSHHGESRDSRARIEKLQQELTRAFFELVERKRAADIRPDRSDSFTLQLTLELCRDGSENRQQLHEQLERAVRQWVHRNAAFPPGQLYCHWCSSFTCDHSAPADPRWVFSGYSATGEPGWRELSAILLEKRDPRVENLYGGDSTPITLLQSARDLTREQLGVYGKSSDRYRLLGQLAFGYVSLSMRRGGRSAPFAVSFQVVQRGALTNPLVLNVIGQSAEGRPAQDLIEASPDPRIANALRSTRQRLHEISVRRVPRRKRRDALRKSAMLALQRLARNLDRIFRQRQRRTLHSQDRHMDRRRPAASAVNDALKAASADIYRDVQAQTWIVLGPKNRVHVFNDNASHVTSIVYPGDTIRQRTTKGKWRAARPEDLATFQETLRRRVSPRFPDPDGK